VGGGDGGGEGESDLVEGGCKTRKGSSGRRGAGRKRRGGGGSSSSARHAQQPPQRRRPLGKKQKMIDRRTTEGKRLAAEQAPAPNVRDSVRVSSVTRP